MPDQQEDKENTMALRVPKAELSTETSRNMIEQLGAVPEPVELLWHNPALRADGAGGVRAPRGLRDAVRRDRRGHREVGGHGATDRAGRIEIDGELAAASFAVENGRIARIYVMRNPRKLTRLDEPAELAR
jgi:RNA polymerase sigma-70 factor (ECF subfamily)